MLQELIDIGLEKYAGDREQAEAFAEGFVKEALMPGGMGFGTNLASGAAKALGGAGVALGVGMGIHGISSAISEMAMRAKHQKFEEALSHAMANNMILREAGPDKAARIRSYAETIFKFAPSVATDANLLAHVLSNSVDGESLDVTTIRALADLESRYEDVKKNRLFTPTAYTR